MSTQASPPQISIRRAQERFHSQFGWLDSWHSFSFGSHDHPAHRGYRSLRVINDDTVASGEGFGTHPHSSMEIFTYIIAGQLEHKDSMGNGRTIQAGEFQYMSAGSGVKHSEFNPSKDQSVHFLQIWITPSTPGGEPRYADIDTKPLRQSNGLTLLASPTGSGNSFEIRQHAELSYGHLDEGHELTPESAYSYHYLHLIKGELELAGKSLKPGDGVAINDPVPLRAHAESEFLFFALS